MKESSHTTPISTRLRWTLAIGILAVVPLWGETSGPPLKNASTPVAAGDFELPAFMLSSSAKTLGSAPSKPEDKATAGDVKKEDAAAIDDAAGLTVAPNAGEFTNKMTVEEIIVSPRQKLLHQPLADIRMEEVPIRDALRYLAEAAGINYILPDMDTDKVTINMHMPPFRAMEVLANNFGLGIYEEEGLWFIRKKDKAQYFAKIYRLKNISLGQSTSGAGVTATTTTGTSGTAGTATTAGTTTTGTTTSGTTSASGTTTPVSSSGSGDTSGSTVMTTLQEILGINVDFGGTIGADGNVSMIASGDASNNSDKKDASTNSANNSSNTTSSASDTYVSYDADANTLFIIATATQHQWVDQYLKAIDNPENNIAIEAMFLESSKSPTQLFGTDWGSANALTITPSSTATSNNNHLAHLPFGGLLSANNLSWGLKAFETETDSQIARYPSVVTQNGRQVQIQTTQNIPLVQQQNLVSSDTQTAAVVSTTSAGTQTIGTTISITPRQINEKLVHLDISIQISSQLPESTANALGQFPSNNSTYTGTVNVPEGYTLAIGGLERIEDELTSGHLPGMGNIPFFGFLFKQKNTTGSTRTNIFLFITPTILKTDKSDGTFMKASEGLSRDWVDKADAQHRSWRRNVIDPEMEKATKNEGKN